MNVVSLKEVTYKYAFYNKILIIKAMLGKIK